MAKQINRPMNIAPRAEPTASDPTAEAMSVLGGARGITRTQAGYHTAINVVKPRDLDTLKARVIQEATYTREDFYYSWKVNDKNSPTGKSLVEGVSIEGAMVLMRNWGNCTYEPEIYDETASHWIFKATFIDLENGISVPRLYRQRKSQRVGKMDAERAEDIALQIGQSKAIRNCIVHGVPPWLIRDAMDAAKMAATARFANPQEHVENILRGFAQYKVSKEMLTERIGAPTEQWLPSDCALLATIYKALKDRQTTVEAEFGKDVPDAEIVDTSGTPSEQAAPSEAAPPIAAPAVNPFAAPTAAAPAAAGPPPPPPTPKPASTPKPDTAAPAAAPPQAASQASAAPVATPKPPEPATTAQEPAASSPHATASSSGGVAGNASAPPAEVPIEAQNCVVCGSIIGDAEAVVARLNDGSKIIRHAACDPKKRGAITNPAFKPPPTRPGKPGREPGVD